MGFIGVNMPGAQKGIIHPCHIIIKGTVLRDFSLKEEF
jgi:hypothetical protein